jgi:hypothetical protein
MDADTGREAPAGFRLNKNIDLGHVGTMLFVIGGLMVQWNMMDKRVAVLEEARMAQRERDVAQDMLTKEKFQEVRDALAGLTRSVEKVSDQVGAQRK